MKRTILLILITLSAFIAQAQVQFTVEVPNVVASGERFRLVYTATDAKVDAFNAPRIEGFSVLAGPTTSTMNRVEYVNGRRTQSRSVSYTYILEAVQTGKFRIGEASVTSEGATYKTQPVTVEVVAGNQTSGRDRSEKEEGSSAEISADDIFLRLNVSKKRVVKGESLTATLKLYTRVNVSGAEDIHF
ncbi:MAG: BatD family protein, partial [Bacteroidales bacterium]|nr:BatD family protein [Bacteroidales bacterium]